MQHDWGNDWVPSTPGKGLGLLPGLAASRHLYETVLRNFVLGVSNIHVQTGAAVNMLEYDTDKQRVTGVLCDLTSQKSDDGSA